MLVAFLGDATESGAGMEWLQKCVSLMLSEMRMNGNRYLLLPNLSRCNNFLARNQARSLVCGEMDLNASPDIYLNYIKRPSE